MSIVILGGNECMERRYKELCEQYNCNAKVFTKPSGNLKSKIGNPDLMVLFTGTVSHKMVKAAVTDEHKDTLIERCHTSSLSALKKILDKYAVCETKARAV